MKNLAITVLILLGVFVGYTVLTSSNVGGTTNFDTIELSEGLTVTGDTVLSGGTLNVTTTNTATSTVIGGCFQFYATSTVTAHKFQASTTPGLMLSVYGACPNL